MIRGLLFYNTVYWRRASDGLNMPSLTAEERERQRPERNLEIIRPRMRPRAHIEVARGAEISEPPVVPVPELPSESVVEEQVHEAPVPTPFRHSSSHRSEQVENDAETEQIYVKRRRYRRRLVSGGSAIDRGSFLARVFGKKDS